MAAWTLSSGSRNWYFNERHLQARAELSREIMRLPTDQIRRDVVFGQFAHLEDLERRADGLNMIAAVAALGEYQIELRQGDGKLSPTVQRAIASGG